MAYQFARINSQYLSTATTPITAVPLTLAAWVQRSVAALHFLVSVGNTSDSCALQLGTNGIVIARFATGNGGTTSGFTTHATQIGQWHHVAAVFESDSIRTAFLDGAVGNTNTVSNTGGVGPYETIQVGRLHGGTSGCDALVADVGIWNVALTAAEIASLAAGVTCSKVRPQSLQFYAPLVRDLVDVRGGRTITNNNGATVANHPRLYL